MQEINLSELSATELEDLINRAEAIKTEKRMREIEDFKARVTEEAKDYGVVVTFEFRGQSVKKARSPRRPSSGTPHKKLRHPDDATKTYSGRGPTPNWLKDLRAAGKDGVPVED